MPPNKKKGKSKSGGSVAAPARHTAEQLYQQAQVALQYDDFDAAKTALKKAVKQEPQNLEVVEAYGALLAELGEVDEAVVALQSAVQLSPNEGHEKYMYLGQMMEPGIEAAGYIAKGLELLQHSVEAATAASNAASEAAAAAIAAAGGGGSAAGKKKTSAERKAESNAAAAEEAEAEAKEVEEELRAQLCGGLCALAEMRVQIAAEAAVAGAAAAAGSSGQEEVKVVIDEAAASEVEALLNKAKVADPTSPEPDQALASLRYEQGKADEALVLLQRSMSLWFKPSKDAFREDMEMGEGEGVVGKEGGGMEMDSDQDDDDDNDDDLPSYEFRHECAKLLLELDSSTKTVIQVLEKMLEEDDSNPETWHLLGLAFYSGGMLEEAQEILERGLEVLKKLELPAEAQIHEDFEDLSGAIQEAVQSAGAGAAMQV